MPRRLHQKVLAPLAKRLRMPESHRPNGVRLPPVMNIEVTNRCNANCLMCPNNEMKRPVGIMEEKLFRKLIDECAQARTRLLWLHLHGEPLMDPHVIDRIRYAKERGLRQVGIFTNASLLNETVAEGILTSGLDILTVSMEGATKESYEKVRRNLDYDIVCDNVRGLMELKHRRARSKPQVIVKATLTPETAPEDEAFRQRWEGVVDVVESEAMHGWGGLIQTPCERQSPRIPKRRKQCSRPWLDMVVYQDGKVPFCCLDMNAEIVIGDASRSSLIDVWNSEKMQEVRTIHLRRDFAEIPMCTDCLAWQCADPWWW